MDTIIKKIYLDRIIPKEKIKEDISYNKTFFRELHYNKDGICICGRLVSYATGKVLLQVGNIDEEKSKYTIRLTSYGNDRHIINTGHKSKFIFSVKYVMDIFYVRNIKVTHKPKDFYLYDDKGKIVKILEIIRN